MSIETLLIKQARLSDLRRQLKSEGCMEAAQCTQMKTDQLGEMPFRTGRSCIEEVYQGFIDSCHDNQYGEESFEDAWEEAVHEGDACQHCQNVRNLKKQRMRAGRELAGVRAAITRVGRRLAREQAA